MRKFDRGEVGANAAEIVGKRRRRQNIDCYACLVYIDVIGVRDDYNIVLLSIDILYAPELA